MDTDNCARKLISHYPDWEGAKVLELLVNHPNTDIYATTAEICLSKQLPPMEAGNARYHLAPIKMTDEQTLKAVKQRLNQLISILAEQITPLSPSSSQLTTAVIPAKAGIQFFSSSRPLDSSTSRHIDFEIRALTQYLKETTLPTGIIKCFNDDDTKAYRRQAAAIRRLLHQATKDGHHEAVAYIKQHLNQGRIMKWEA
jgi:hypothetical protein